MPVTPHVDLGVGGELEDGCTEVLRMEDEEELVAIELDVEDEATELEDEEVWVEDARLVDDTMEDDATIELEEDTSPSQRPKPFWQVSFLQ